MRDEIITHDEDLMTFDLTLTEEHVVDSMPATSADTEVDHGGDPVFGPGGPVETINTILHYITIFSGGTLPESWHTWELTKVWDNTATTMDILNFIDGHSTNGLPEEWRAMYGKDDYDDEVVCAAEPATTGAVEEGGGEHSNSDARQADTGIKGDGELGGALVYHDLDEFLDKYMYPVCEEQ